MVHCRVDLMTAPVMHLIQWCLHILDIVAITVKGLAYLPETEFEMCFGVIHLNIVI